MTSPAKRARAQIRASLETMVLMMTVGLFALIGWWLSDRMPPVILKSAHAIEGATPGGHLDVRWSVVRRRVCSSIRQDMIISAGGHRWVIPPVVVLGPPGPTGSDDTFTTSTPIPSDVPKGSASLRVTILYQCNPVHSVWPISVTLPEVLFSVS